MKLKSYLRGLGTGLFISAVLMGIAVSGKEKEISDTEIRTRARALGMVEEDSVLVKPTEETAAGETGEANALNKPEDKKETEPSIKTENTDSKGTGEAADKTEDKPEVKPEDQTEDKAGTVGEEEPADKSAQEDKSGTGRKDTGVAVLEEDPEPEEETGTEGEEDKGDIRDSKEDRAMGGQSEKKSSNEKVTGLQNSSKELGYNEFFTIQIASGSSSETVSGLLKRGGAVDDAKAFDDYLCKNHYDKKITPGVFKIPVGADYEQIADIITGGK